MFLFVVFIIVILLVIFICVFKKERFGLSTGVKLPSIPGNINQSADGWQFVPATGYYGPVKINYVLTDSKTYVPSSILLNISNVLQPINADNPNPSLQPIDPYATTFPSYFKDSQDKYFFGFTAESLFNMVKLKGGEINQNIDKIVFSKITPILNSSELIYASGTSLNNFVSSTEKVKIESVSSSSSFPVNAINIDSNKIFVFSVPNTNTSNISVSIEFYFIDSANYGQTIAPGLTSLYPMTGPFTLSFTIPVLYKNPVPIPVDLTSQLFLENSPIPLSNSTLVGTSRKSPTGEQLVASNLILATCKPGSAINLTSKDCSPCAGGTYNDNEFGYGWCIDCPVGNFCQSGAINPQLCPAGNFCDTTKLSSGKPCPTGSFSGSTGSISCTQCGVGTFSGSPGSISCTKCDPGKYADTLGSTTCKMCDAGTFSTGGAKICENCKAGTYSGWGVASCTSCLEGTYSGPRATECINCPSNQTSNSDKSGCTQCPSGQYSSWDSRMSTLGICKLCNLANISSMVMVRENTWMNLDTPLTIYPCTYYRYGQGLDYVLMMYSDGNLICMQIDKNNNNNVSRILFQTSTQGNPGAYAIIGQSFDNCIEIRGSNDNTIKKIGYNRSVDTPGKLSFYGDGHLRVNNAAITVTIWSAL